MTERLRKTRFVPFALVTLALLVIAGFRLVGTATALPAEECNEMFIDCLNDGHSAGFCGTQRTACLDGSGGGSGGGPAGPSCGQILWACVDAGYPVATCEMVYDDCLSGGSGPGPD